MWETCYMKLTKGINPVVRAVGVFSAVAIITGGVTYAAFTNTATLADNSVLSADAGLQVSNGGAYDTSVQGFVFDDLIPGTFTSPKNFYLKNTGDSNLNVTVHVPAAPGTASDYGFTGWENLKVQFTALNPVCTGAGSVVTTDMQALLDGDVALPCNPLGIGEQGTADSTDNAGDYKLAFKVEEASVNPGATKIDINNIDLDFKGTITAAPVVTLP